MLDEELRGTNAMIVETCDNNNHVFYLVNEDNKNYLKYEDNPQLISKLIIKPDFWAFFKDGGYEHGIKLLKSLPNFNIKLLATNYYIDPNIFELLINSNLISYSKAMADLYELPVSCSFDIKHHLNDYKRKKTKNLVLEKMRKGIFN